MRVLVDITHPVNVHFFKHLVRLLGGQGHEVLVTSRDKDVTAGLLDGLGIAHVCVSRRRSGLAGLARELLERDVRLYRVARRFRPDVMVAAEAGVSIGPVGAALGVPRVIFEQVDRAPLQQALGHPFATFICTGLGYRRDHGPRQVRFRGFLAQSYLDPRRFHPDPRPVRGAGIDPDEPYVILRLVRWSATHDVGRQGPQADELERAVRRLGRFGRVLISSEGPLPESLQANRCPVAPMHFHDLLALARLCVAEGGTVAPEAGMLGVPAVCCNTYDFGYLRALEKGYGLIRRVRDLSEALGAAEELAADAGAGEAWRRKAARLFRECEDVLAFMGGMVERAGTGKMGRR